MGDIYNFGMIWFIKSWLKPKGIQGAYMACRCPFWIRIQAGSGSKPDLDRKRWWHDICFKGWLIYVTQNKRRLTDKFPQLHISSADAHKEPDADYLGVFFSAERQITALPGSLNRKGWSSTGRPPSWSAGDPQTCSSQLPKNKEKIGL